MKTLAIGKSNLITTRLAYGCWRLAGTTNPAEVTSERVEAGCQIIHAAFEAGYSLFDHADIYCGGLAESIFGQALKQAPGMRDRVVITSKCGIRFAGDPSPEAPYRYDFSADYIIGSCEQSLKRLQLETIDLYQLHRPDFLMQPEEVARAFSQLKQAGKVREFGVSNFHPAQVRLLQQYCPMSLIVNQVEINLMRLDCLSDGTLDHCQAETITPLAWSPLGGGRISAGWQTNLQDPNRAKNVSLFLVLDSIARERGVSWSVIALAWLLRHPARIVPIVGSTKIDRIREFITADTIELTREEWYRLLVAARGENLP